MTKTNKTGMNAKTGAAVVIEVVSEAAFVPSNANDIAAVVAGFSKRAKKEAHQFLQDVNSIALVTYPMIDEMVESKVPYDKGLITGAIHAAAGFTTTPEVAKDAQGQEVNARIKSFVSMRINRGVQAAMAAYVGKDQGYHLAPKQDEGSKIMEGSLLAPNNKVKKTIVDKDDEGNIIDDKALNTDTHPTLVPQKSVPKHLNILLPGSVSERPGAVKAGQGKSTDATSALDGYETLMDSVNGVNSGKPMTGFADLDRSAIRKLIKITQTAKNIHNIALTNDCDGAMQYLMKMLDNSKDEAAVA